MFLWSTISHFRRAVPCSRAFYSRPAWNVATLGCVQGRSLDQAAYSAFKDDSALLERPELIVSKVLQKSSRLPILDVRAQDTSFHGFDTRFAPKPHTSTWAIPSLALFHAKAFFALHPLATDFKYAVQLISNPRPDPINDTRLEYRVSVRFSRNEDGLVEADQQMTGQSKSVYGYPHRRSSAGLFCQFGALWESPQGATILSNEELDVVAASIFAKELDLVEPLEAALLQAKDDLGQPEGFRLDKAVETSYDVLDRYQRQQQAWRPGKVNFHVSDMSSTKYRVQTPAHHLGQPYEGSNISHRAIIALGSNVGDRLSNIERSLRAMQHQGLDVRSTSFLYETEAMYYEDQDRFLNGVCEIRTFLDPLALLEVLQKVETEVGRVKLIDKGPRSNDLDILLYDSENVQHDRLLIPHKLMLEREFVLRPLADIIPGERLPPPHTKQSILGYLEELEIGRDGPAPSVVSSLGTNLPHARPNDSSRSTNIMAVLNITPDSFSDGGQYDAGDLTAIEAKIKQVIANGATIIDVGGQSTRPSATKISWQEELGRIRPVIERIRSIPEAQKIAVSVDTFYAEVARGAVAAGADIINDVSGGLLDPQMLPLIAELQVTIVLMHMRGTPEDMNDLTDYPEGVVIGVAKELLERLKAAEEAGIPRWRIVLDPGIGFAKTQAQNLELLRNLEALRSYPGLRNYPWLVGTSRKGFIGKITGVSTAAERGWGTAATVTTSIAGGADIVRVHDVPEMAQVAKMADAMYRVEPKSKKTSSTASGLSRPPSTITDNESERGRSKGLKLSRRFYEAIVRSRSEVGLTTASLQNPAKGYSHQSVKFVPELKARARTGRNFAFSRSRI